MPELNDKQREGIDGSIYAGRKIEAIKLYREVVPGIELVDAKKWVEDREVELRFQHPEKFITSSKKGGCVGVLGFVTLVLAAISFLILLALRA